ncbi:MAG: HPF/RaiA family ribosome-associated protein [Rhodoferax sp.]
MQVQVQTDTHIQHTDGMDRWASETVQQKLQRFDGQVTRVELHLSDLSGGKNPDQGNIQCTLESRPQGLPPLAVKHQGNNVNQAIEGALEKSLRQLESALARAA